MISFDNTEKRKKVLNRKIEEENRSFNENKAYEEERKILIVENRSKDKSERILLLRRIR